MTAESLTQTVSFSSELEIVRFKIAEVWTWLSTRQLMLDSIKLAGELPLDCGGILGVPRSGMLPAAAIATQLNLPLYTIEDATHIRRCRHDHGRSAHSVKGHGKKLVVIDDSIYNGSSMALVKAGLVNLDFEKIYATVYALPETAHMVDIYARAVEWPFLAEWNLINNRGWASVMGYDLDGVIVHDDESGGRPGTPFMLPRASPVRLIVTGRPESMRKVTEEQLRQLGIDWTLLEMMPGSSFRPWQANANLKSEIYKKSGCKVFVESCPNQAATIAKNSGKAVICPRAERVFGVSSIEHDPKAPLWKIPSVLPEKESENG